MFVLDFDWLCMLQAAIIKWCLNKNKTIYFQPKSLCSPSQGVFFICLSLNLGCNCVVSWHVICDHGDNLSHLSGSTTWEICFLPITHLIDLNSVCCLWIAMNMLRCRNEGARAVEQWSTTYKWRLRKGLQQQRQHVGLQAGVTITITITGTVTAQDTPRITQHHSTALLDSGYTLYTTPTSSHRSSTQSVEVIQTDNRLDISSSSMKWNLMTYKQNLWYLCLVV